VAWLLALYGLRRGEVAGLRWDRDVDLDAGTLTVSKTRLSVDGAVVEGDPKSERGKRTLPLTRAVVRVFRHLRRRVTVEPRGGSAYVDSGCVVSTRSAARYARTLCPIASTSSSPEPGSVVSCFTTPGTHAGHSCISAGNRWRSSPPG
jgi:integrase